jgi:hypothetical protein
VRGHGDDRRNFISSGLHVFAERIDERTHKASQKQAHRDEWDRPGRCLSKEYVHDRFTVGAVRTLLMYPTSMRGCFAMMQLGGCRDHDPRTHALRTPTQIQIVAEKRQLWIEAAEGIPHVAPHEHSRRTHGQDISHTVVLALIMFARLESGDPSASTTDGYTHLEQEAPVMPTKNLRTQDGGLGMIVRGIEQRL